MKSIFALLSVAFLSFAAFALEGHQEPPTHLHFSDGIHAHAMWVKGPQITDESVMQIQFINHADHTPINPPGGFTLELWMPAHGHGSSPVTIAQANDDKGVAITGLFTVTQMYFTMSGDWEVRVTRTLTTGAPETVAIPVHLEGQSTHRHR